MNIILILGQKYTFTNLELKILKKQPNKIRYITYKNKNPKDVITQIEKTLKKNYFTMIVLNTKAKVDDEIIKYLTNLKYKMHNFKIISIEHFLEKYLHKCYIPEDNNDLHFLDDIKGYTKFQYFQKRVIDYIFSILLLMFFLIIKPLVKKKIKSQSPGDIYFKQLRVGYQNKEFKCIKFRSMYLDAEKHGIKFASKDDDRVFPFGKIMRKTRIDEIPQVFNILKNEMHLIGPRPERKFWTDQFEEQIPYYNQRHIVRPGITGWAQVMYPYGSSVEDAKQKLMYDLYYIKHWSILLELKIVWKTVMVVLKKKGV